MCNDTEMRSLHHVQYFPYVQGRTEPMYIWNITLYNHEVINLDSYCKRKAHLFKDIEMTILFIGTELYTVYIPSVLCFSVDGNGKLLWLESLMKHKQQLQS